MTEPTKPPKENPWADPAARNYLAFGLAALLVLGFALFERGAWVWWMLTPGVGAAGLAYRWGSAPVFVVLTALVPLVLAARSRPQETPVADAILCAALLAYLVAQYRLYGLLVGVFPADPRRLVDWPGRPSAPRRFAWPLRILGAATIIPGSIYLWRQRNTKSPGPAIHKRHSTTVADAEFGQALLLVISITAAVVGLWWVLPSRSAPINIPAPAWRLGLMAWFLAFFGLGAWAAISYLSWRRLTPEEATLFLQDTLWHETRREQRHLARWVAWGRSKLERK